MQRKKGRKMREKVASNIYKLAENKYQVICLRRDKTTQKAKLFSKTIYGTLKQAEDFQKQLKEKGEKYKKGEILVDEKLTLKHLFEKYFEVLETRKKEPVKIDHKNTCFQLTRFFGDDFPVKKLSLDELDKFINWRKSHITLDTKTPIKFKTINKSLKYLNAALNIAKLS